MEFSAPLILDLQAGFVKTNLAAKRDRIRAARHQAMLGDRT